MLNTNMHDHIYIVERSNASATCGSEICYRLRESLVTLIEDRCSRQ